MGYMLLPNDVVVPHPTVPYVGKERYDGLPWLLYPVRKAKAQPGFSVSDYVRFESRHPTPPREKESFLQTWLLFGLLEKYRG
jgi:hypothetical protein